MRNEGKNRQREVCGRAAGGRRILVREFTKESFLVLVVACHFSRHLSHFSRPPGGIVPARGCFSSSLVIV